MMFAARRRRIRLLRESSTRVRPLRLAYVLWSAAAIASGQGKIPGSSPTIPVALDGVSGPFLIDTGAESSVVDSGFAGHLHLSQTGTASVRGNYFSENRPVVTVKRVQVGNKLFAGVSFIEADLSTISLAQSVPLAGIIGSDLLSSAKLRISYSSGVAELADRIDDTAHKVTLKRAAGGFFVPVRIGGAEYDLLLDTGTNSTVISEWAWNQIPPLKKPGPMVRGIRSTGGGASTALGCASSVEFGGFALRDHAIRVASRAEAGNFSSDGFAGLLGTDLLEGFDVTLDLANSAIFLRPNSGYRSDAYAYTSIGIQFFRMTDGAFSVAAVWEQSPAADSGILAGDQIVSIDGESTHDMDVRSFAERLHRPAGTNISLEIRRPAGTTVVHTATRQLVCGGKLDAIIHARTSR